jgi:disulfide oxidoreductase YuzD
MLIDELVNDFAIVTYLKNNSYSRHEKQIRAEAMERIYQYGAALVNEEVVSREHARLKQMVLDFEQIHGLNK